MTRQIPRAAATALICALSSANPAAAGCAMDGTNPLDWNAAQIDALYGCIQSSMAAAYASAKDPVGRSFRDWTPAATRPALSGPHGSRLLQTYANDIAAPQYLRFAAEDVAMPPGSILAKETITLDSAAQMGRIGPLFVMTKLTAGTAPETQDWLYSTVQPDGRPGTIQQATCHTCHAAWDDQDMLAYPLEQIRRSN